MNKFLSLLIILSALSMKKELVAQVYIDQKTQHRFAQTYFGLNTQFVPSSGRLVWQNYEQPFPSQILPRFTLGGLHFWGKLDFNLNIPITASRNKDLIGDGSINFNTGADLSVRYYPWQLVDNKFRPFAGLSFNTMKLSLENESLGVRAEGFLTYSLLAGLSFAHKGWQINAEVMFLPRNKREFYSDNLQKHQFELPRSYVSIGLLKFFDFTLEEEKGKVLGETQAMEEMLLDRGNLNSFSIGIAASSTYFIKSPDFSGDLVSLPNHKGSFNIEYGLGYLFHEAKLHIGLTYRNYSSSSVSYDLEHIIRREALSFEAFKFLWDYNGFVPFLGVSLSTERWASGLFVNDVQQGETAQDRLFSPGIILGWDIVSSPLITWVLRTNLRYYPFQKINDLHLEEIRVDQFEFNFIQFVFYPNRWNKMRKAKRYF